MPCKRCVLVFLLAVLPAVALAKVSAKPASRDPAEEARRLGILDAVRRHQPRLPEPVVRRIGAALVVEAKRHRLDPLLLAAVAEVESAFDPEALSSAGARGLLQVMVPTAQELFAKDGTAFSLDALHHVETNVALGARYLAWLQRQFPRVDEALLAYNRGPTGARRVLATDAGPRLLGGYPRKVLASWGRFREQEPPVRQVRLGSNTEPTAQ